MNNTKTYLRKDWPRFLLALPAQKIKEITQTLTKNSQVEDLTLPSSGLALLQLQDSALAETYYIGEIPLSKAHVIVTDKHGQKGEGVAQILDDRASMAKNIAILDAILGNALDGYEIVLELLKEGARKVASQTAFRNAILERTRVDFSLLNTSVEDNDNEN